VGGHGTLHPNRLKKAGGTLPPPNCAPEVVSSFSPWFVRTFASPVKYWKVGHLRTQNGR